MLRPPHALILSRVPEMPRERGSRVKTADLGDADHAIPIAAAANIIWGCDHSGAAAPRSDVGSNPQRSWLSGNGRKKETVSSENLLANSQYVSLKKRPSSRVRVDSSSVPDASGCNPSKSLLPGQQGGGESGQHHARLGLTRRSLKCERVSMWACSPSIDKGIATRKG